MELSFLLENKIDLVTPESLSENLMAFILPEVGYLLKSDKEYFRSYSGRNQDF